MTLPGICEVVQDGIVKERLEDLAAPQALQQVQYVEAHWQKHKQGQREHDEGSKYRDVPWFLVWVEVKEVSNFIFNLASLVMTSKRIHSVECVHGDCQKFVHGEDEKCHKDIHH